MSHPGSLAHLKSIENYILYIVRRACFGGPPTGGDTGDTCGPTGGGDTGENPLRKRLCVGNPCALGILGRGGEDLFQHEVEPKVREGFECRTAEQVREFYTEDVRGTLDVLHSGWRLTPLALAAYDGDAKALLLLLAHNEPGHAPSAAAYNGHEDCLRV